MNILDPQGPIGIAQKQILFGSIAIMLAIVIPTIIATFAFALWFRRSNAKARHLPNWAYSGRVELVVWSIPALTVILLGGVAWIGAHVLDPAKPIESSTRALEIQVVSLDWKWLFIYPDQRVATINTLTVPVGTPLHFSLTSSSVMNAFFIPQFGSMIYTMNGMTTHLNLQSDRLGTFQGLSSHFSGDGFSAMGFDVRVVPQADFTAWADEASHGSDALTAETYEEFAKPSIAGKPRTLRLDDARLFDAVVTQEIAPASTVKAHNVSSSDVQPTSGHSHAR